MLCLENVPGIARYKRCYLGKQGISHHSHEEGVQKVCSQAAKGHMQSWYDVQCTPYQLHVSTAWRTQQLTELCVRSTRSVQVTPYKQAELTYLTAAMNQISCMLLQHSGHPSKSACSVCQPTSGQTTSSALDGTELNQAGMACWHPHCWVHTTFTASAFSSILLTTKTGCCLEVTVG